MTTTSSAPEGRSRGRGTRRATGVIAAVAAAITTWIVLTTGLGIDLDSRAGPVTASAVLATGLAAGLGGWLVLAALERLGDHAGRRWTVIALVVLVLSLLGPLSQAATLAAGFGLALLHLAVGAVLIPVLAGTARP